MTMRTVQRLEIVASRGTRPSALFATRTKSSLLTALATPTSTKHQIGSIDYAILRTGFRKLWFLLR